MPDSAHRAADAPESTAVEPRPRRHWLFTVLWPSTIRPRLSRLIHRPTRAEISAAISGADLPVPLAGLIRTVLRRARLWRSEQLDVARELSAHFSDGLRAGARPEALAASFGDPRRAARLIRRAKRRARPLWWQSLRMARRGLTIFLIASAAIYTFIAIRYFTDSPRITRDYIAELDAPARAIPEPDRALPLYLAAVRSLTPFPPDFTGTRPGRVPSVGPPEPPTNWVAHNTAPITAIREAAAKPHLGALLAPGRADPSTLAPPDNPPLFACALPFTGHARTAARALDLDARVAADQRDADRLAADLTAMHRLAAHTREQPFLVTELVAGSIDVLTLQRLMSVLASDPDLLSIDTLRTLAHTLAALPDPADRFTAALRTERLGFLDAIQRVYTDDGRGGGRIAGSSSAQVMSPFVSEEPWTGPTPLAPITATLGAGRREVVAIYDDAIRRTIDALHTPRWQRTIDDDPDRVLLAKLEDGTVRGLRYWPARMLVPALGPVVYTADTQRTLTDAALAAIALELFRRDHGDYPDSLSALVPTYLPRLPLDPIDGAPLRSTRPPADAAAPRTPIVYSIGVDRTDDHGRPPATGNAWAFPRSQALAASDPATWPATYRAQYAGDWLLYPPP